jgi:N-acetylglucosamine malate deacetylase 1
MPRPSSASNATCSTCPTGASSTFIPHPEDAHPDHLAVTRNAEDARFDAKLTRLDLPGDMGQPPLYPRWVFYYYCSHLRRVPDPTFVMDITATEQKKMAAIAAYRSQFVDNSLNIQVPEWIAAGNRYFGSRIGTQAGEPFWCREPLALNSLAALPL